MKEIINKYKYGIKSIIKNITGSNNEDLEQEVYIKAWKNLGNYKEQNKFDSWIYKIAQNTCKDFLKSSWFKKSKVTDTDEEHLRIAKDKTQNPESEFIKKQRQKIIFKAIEKLPQKQKEVIILYDINGLSYDQIAKKLKCPEGTVKSRLYNARKELSVSLKEII